VIGVNTSCFKIDPVHPQMYILEQAARIILNQQLVAFPTETVYGLGAAAFSPEAVQKAFQVKQRPLDRPLLIHVSNINQLDNIVQDVPPFAQVLMDKFWPGPLSIILPSQENVPSIVRGGQSKVGIRMPSHPVALALIHLTGPIAAPSANLHGRPSPVTAEHVKNDLNGKISCILDAGHTGGGLESTLIDCSFSTPKVLRRGGVSVEDLEELLNDKIEVVSQLSLNQVNTQVVLADNEKDLETKLQQYTGSNKKVALVTNNQTMHKSYPGVNKYYYIDLFSRNDSLYSILRDSENNSIDVLLFAPLPDKLNGTALSWLDRINKFISRQEC